jgi:hypothetical protein
MKLHLPIRPALGRRGAVVLGVAVLAGAASGGVALAASGGTTLHAVPGVHLPVGVHLGKLTVVRGVPVPRGHGQQATTVAVTGSGPSLVAVGGTVHPGTVHPGTATAVPGVVIPEGATGRTTAAG